MHAFSVTAVFVPLIIILYICIPSTKLYSATKTILDLVEIVFDKVILDPKRHTIFHRSFYKKVGVKCGELLFKKKWGELRSGYLIVHYIIINGYLMITRIFDLHPTLLSHFVRTQAFLQLEAEYDQGMGLLKLASFSYILSELPTVW
jgi:hypothetical protein